MTQSIAEAEAVAIRDFAATRDDGPTLPGPVPTTTRPSTAASTTASTSRPQRAVPRMSNWQVAIVLSLLMAVCLGTNVVLNPWESNDLPEILSFATFGIAVSQLMVLGIWAALAPQPWSDRLPLAILLAGAIACSHALATLLENGAVGREAWELSVVLLTLIALAWAITWLIAPRFHWRMWRMQGGRAARIIDGRTAGQFTVRGLLLWVTLAAALLAVTVRVFPSTEVIAGDSGLGWAVLDDVLTSLDETDQPPFIMLYVVGAACLPLALANRRWVVPASVIAVVACSAVTVAIRYKEDDWGASEWYEIGQILLALACVMIVSLLIVRSCGFRVAISKRDEAWLAQATSGPSGETWPSAPRRHGKWAATWRFAVSSAILLAALSGLGWQAAEKLPDWRDHWLESAWSETGLEATYAHGRLVGLSWKRAVPAVSDESLPDEMKDRLSPVQVEWIAREEFVPNLDIDHCTLTDDQLSDLGRIRGLKHLSMRRSKITDAGLAHLAQMPHLEELDLAANPIKGMGLAHLANLHRLRMLDLSGTEITDDALAHVAHVRGLEQVSLVETAITDAGLVHLAGMAQLADLDLSQTQITDSGLSHLARCGGLKRLNLTHTNVSDPGLVHLMSIPNLDSLFLDHTNVTDTGLPTLARSRKLVSLHLPSVEVTPEGVQKLQAAMPQATIERPSPQRPY